MSDEKKEEIVFAENVVSVEGAEVCPDSTGTIVFRGRNPFCLKTLPDLLTDGEKKKYQGDLVEFKGNYALKDWAEETQECYFDLQDEIYTPYQLLRTGTNFQSPGAQTPLRIPGLNSLIVATGSLLSRHTPTGVVREALAVPLSTQSLENVLEKQVRATSSLNIGVEQGVPKVKRPFSFQTLVVTPPSYSVFGEAKEIQRVINPIIDARGQQELPFNIFLMSHKNIEKTLDEIVENEKRKKNDFVTNFSVWRSIMDTNVLYDQKVANGTIIKAILAAYFWSMEPIKAAALRMSIEKTGGSSEMVTGFDSIVRPSVWENITDRRITTAGFRVAGKDPGDVSDAVAKWTKNEAYSLVEPVKEITEKLIKHYRQSGHLPLLYIPSGAFQDQQQKGRVWGIVTVTQEEDGKQISVICPIITNILEQGGRKVGAEPEEDSAE